MGVREAVVLVNGQVVYEGDVDKGCGNQVFDYCKTIFLTRPDSHKSSSSNTSPDSAAPINNGKQPAESPRQATTPAIDNVSFHSEDDSEEELQPLQLSDSSRSLQKQIRSETRCTNRNDTDLTLPVVDSMDLKNKSRKDSKFPKSPKTPSQGQEKESSKPKGL